MKKILLLLLILTASASADTSGTNYTLRSSLKKNLKITGSFPMQGDLDMNSFDIINAGDLDVSTITTDSIIVALLTATRVIFAGTGGLLSDDADLTFLIDTLYAANLTSTGTITGGTLTDGTASLTGGNITSMGNITGTDVDISAGTGDYISSGGITTGGDSILGDDIADTHNIVGSLNVGGPVDHLVIDSDGDTHWDGDGGLLVGSMFIPGVDIEVSTGDALPHEVKSATSDGWQASALNEITFPTGGDEHYLTVSEIGLYKCDWEISAHTGGGGATAIHGGIMVDDVAQRNDGEGHTHVSNFNDDQSLGSPALVNCPNGNEEISLWISADNSQDVHVEHGTLFVMMVAGPTVLAPENVIFNGEDVIFNAEQVVYP